MNGPHNAGMFVKKTVNRRVLAALAVAVMLLFGQTYSALHVVDHADEAHGEDICLVCIAAGSLDSGADPASPHQVEPARRPSAPVALSLSRFQTPVTCPPARGPPAIS